MKQNDSSYQSLGSCERKIRAIDDTMDLLNGRWKISIIARLCDKPMRYSELLKNINGISGKMLSCELKNLEINHLITRGVSETKPLAVTYSISDYGITLKNLTDSIAEWGIIHREKIVKQN